MINVTLDFLTKTKQQNYKTCDDVDTILLNVIQIKLA